MIEKLTKHRKTNSRGAIIYPPSSLEICEKVNEIIDFLNSDSVVKVTEKDCCPVGSEDERIRKEIAVMVNFFYGTNLAFKHSFSKNEMLAWLEKQAEHANFRNKIQIGDKVTRNEDGVLVNLSQLKRVAKKQDEQKPADKVEPKFHEGEWLVHNDLVGVTFCITQIHAPHYYLTNNNSFIKFGEEDNYRPWTIQDAKDGDVLADDYGIYIFDRFDECDETCFICMGAYQYSQKVYENEHMLCSVEAHPATKEQRDTLEKAMFDAGYTFDFEKKELKKVESRQEELTEFEKAVKQVMEEAIECGDTHNLKADADMLLRLAQKTVAWSEEDEEMFEHIIAKATLHFSSINYLDEEEINFLKSLKERVLPQPKQEWSEEDEGMLYGVIETEQYMLDVVTGVKTFDVGNEQIESQCTKELAWLKILKDRCTWKPSDEQMNLLREVQQALLGKDCHNRFVNFMYELKRLREK